MSENQIETIAVTGATGFIGQAVLRRLAGLKLQVRVLVRPRSLGKFQARPAVQVIEGDLADEGALERLVAGTQAVLHCAGMVRDGHGAFQEINVQGTRRLARVIARQTAPPHIVAISSLAAREPQLSAYSASKREGESVLIEQLGRASWTILRPPAVYGPGDRELLPLFKWMMRGIAPILGSPGARFSLIFVDDLADCLLRLMGDRQASGAIYELHDGHENGYGWDEVGQAIHELSGCRQRRLHVPASLATFIAGINLVAQRLLGGAPMFTPGKVREFRHADWVCDDSPLMAATSWRPQVQLDQGLRKTLLPATCTRPRESTEAEKSIDREAL